jgi:hypothetical protein
MRWERYKECLELVAERYGVQRTILKPVMATDLFAVERALGMTLPASYATFLEEVGVGEEFGGLSEWLHCDLMRSGNVVEIGQEMLAAARAKMARPRGSRRLPPGFLPIYDDRDGLVYGFSPKDSHSYEEAVFAWDGEEMELSLASPSFADFLDFLIGDHLGESL